MIKVPDDVVSTASSPVVVVVVRIDKNSKRGRFDSEPIKSRVAADSCKSRMLKTWKINEGKLARLQARVQSRIRCFSARSCVKRLCRDLLDPPRQDARESQKLPIGYVRPRTSRLTPTRDIASERLEDRAVIVASKHARRAGGLQVGKEDFGRFEIDWICFAYIHS
jgi:hypothetical protein